MITNQVYKFIVAIAFFATTSVAVNNDPVIGGFNPLGDKSKYFS